LFAYVNIYNTILLKKYIFKKNYTSRTLTLSIPNENNIFLLTQFFYSTDVLNGTKIKIHVITCSIIYIDDEYNCVDIYYNKNDIILSNKPKGQVVPLYTFTRRATGHAVWRRKAEIGGDPAGRIPKEKNQQTTEYG